MQHLSDGYPCYSVKFADIDGDGDQDILSGNSNYSRAWLNQQRRRAADRCAT